MTHLSNSSTSMSFSNLSKNQTKKLCFQNLILPKSSETPLRPEAFESLDKAYKKAQNSIKQHIEIYNAKVHEMIQTLTDMQIKDIMYFNQLLQKNEKNYAKKEMLEFVEIPPEQVRRIYDIQKTVMRVICSPVKSFQTRATFDSKNKSNLSQNSSTTAINRISFKGSERSNKILDSKKEKSKGSLQDTPESIKSKISCVNKIKPEKETVIRMFDRIDVCESVEERHDVVGEYYEGNKEKESGSRRQKQKGKVIYRYGSYSEE